MYSIKFIYRAEDSGRYKGFKLLENIFAELQFDYGNIGRTLANIACSVAV